MENNFKVPYGIDSNNNIVKIAKANPKQIYYCNCGSELIVKNGNIYSKHFAHKNSENCTPESWIHKECKNILLENKKIKYFDNIKNRTITLIFDEVILEKSINDFIPDAIGLIGDKQYIIEFRYTHKVNENKLKKIKLANVWAIEFYTYYFPLEREGILDYLTNKIDNREVIYDPYFNKDDVVKFIENEYKKELASIVNMHKKEIEDLKLEYKINLQSNGNWLIKENFELKEQIQYYKKNKINIHKIKEFVSADGLLRLNYKEELLNGNHHFKHDLDNINAYVNSEYCIIDFGINN